MTILGMKLDKVSTVNLVLSAVILIAFFFFTLISAVGIYSGTAGNLFFNFSQLYNAFSSFGASESDLSGLGMLRIFMALLYAIPVFIAISYAFLFGKKDVKEFDRFIMIGYIINTILLVIIFIARMIILSQIKKSLGDLGMGFLALGGFSVNGLLSLGFGYYVILFCSIGGFIYSIFAGEQNPTEFIQNLTKSKPSTQPQTSVQSQPKLESQPVSTVPSTPQAEPKPVVREESSQYIQEPISKKVLSLAGPINKVVIDTFPVYVIKDNNKILRFVDENHPSQDKIVINTLDGDYYLNSSGFNDTYLNNEILDPGSYYEIQEGDILLFANEPITIATEEQIVTEINDLDPKRSSVHERAVKAPILSESNIRNEFEPVQDSPFGEKTVALGKNRNSTIRLDYNGGQTDFPIMSLVSSGNDFTLIDKTPFIVGFDPSRVDYQINEAGISKQHFVIERIRDEFYIKDLGSTNGTVVNGYEIAPDKPFPLRVGDVIEVGSKSYTFEDA